MELENGIALDGEGNPLCRMGAQLLSGWFVDS